MKIRKWILAGGLISIPVLIFAAVLISSSKRDPTYPVTSPETRQNSTPSTDLPKTIEGEVTSEYKGYPYRFKRDGNKTIALFVTRFLPRDDTIVTGAIRDVISRSYKDDATSAARLVDWNSGGTPTRAIRIDSKTSGYVVIPVKEDSGEIHSLVITQVPST